MAVAARAGKAGFHARHKHGSELPAGLVARSRRNCITPFAVLGARSLLTNALLSEYRNHSTKLPYETYWLRCSKLIQ